MRSSPRWRFMPRSSHRLFCNCRITRRRPSPSKALPSRSFRTLNLRSSRSLKRSPTSRPRPKKRPISRPQPKRRRVSRLANASRHRRPRPRPRPRHRRRRRRQPRNLRSLSRRLRLRGRSRHPQLRRPMRRRTLSTCPHRRAARRSLPIPCQNRRRMRPQHLLMSLTSRMLDWMESRTQSQRPRRRPTAASRRPMFRRRPRRRRRLRPRSSPGRHRPPEEKRARPSLHRRRPRRLPTHPQVRPNQDQGLRIFATRR